MTRDALIERIGELVDAVLADWRWVPDDLNVSILGMILYGFATASAQEMGLTVEDIDTAVLRCMTERVGAASKWSPGLMAEANASARDKAHHPGHHELIGVGRTYHGIADRQALVNGRPCGIRSCSQRAEPSRQQTGAA
jgi:hypothetical protein